VWAFKKEREDVYTCGTVDERDGFHVFGNLNLFHHTMLFLCVYMFVFVCYGRCNNLTSKSFFCSSSCSCGQPTNRRGEKGRKGNSSPPLLLPCQYQSALTQQQSTELSEIEPYFKEEREYTPLSVPAWFGPREGGFRERERKGEKTFLSNKLSKFKRVLGRV
jgi:hypothetical protein